MTMPNASIKSPAQWQGRDILDQEHGDQLEVQSALHEFQDRMPRGEAEDKAHKSYQKDHHLHGAAHHYQGMQAAQASGHMEEAKKHGALYALHMKAVGEDPYAEVPAEVKRRSEDPERDRVYRFRPHKSDLFVLNSKLEKGEVIHFNRLAKGEPQPSKRQEPTMAKKNEQTPELDPKQTELKKALQEKVDQRWSEVHAQDDASLQKSEQTRESLNTLARAARMALEIATKQNAPAPSTLSKKEQLRENLKTFWEKRDARPDDLGFKYEE